jgi:hypothetical protein
MFIHSLIASKAIIECFSILFYIKEGAAHGMTPPLLSSKNTHQTLLSIIISKK